MATSTSLSFFKFALSSYLTFILISFSLRKGHALEESQAAEINSYSVDISSILPPFSCKPTTSKGPSGKASVALVHRYGPCNVGESKQLTLAQILELDQSRVASIQARHASNLKANGVGDSEVSIPAQSGVSVGTLNYVVKVGLGSPANLYTLEFDTGSDLTWTKCQTCVGSCPPQNYDPSKSATYTNVSCASTECSQLVSGGCSGSTCPYSTRYKDGSGFSGFLGKETLTLGSDAIPNFLFGCAQVFPGISEGTAGLIGLDRGSISVVSQTADKYAKVFSYCLPTRSGSGFLSFGGGGSSSGVAFTPLVNTGSGSFYFVSLQGISVGGRLLNISPSDFETGGTIIDSGTVITRLPPAAYSALRAAFKLFMANYTMAPGTPLLDTCYDFSGQTPNQVPIISFFFGGNVNVDLGLASTLIGESANQVCLAFAGNSAATDHVIFGNIQQQTLQVVYDVAGGRLGFGAGGCS